MNRAATRRCGTASVLDGIGEIGRTDDRAPKVWWPTPTPEGVGYARCANNVRWCTTKRGSRKGCPYKDVAHRQGASFNEASGL
jgi:hypothetical protein